MKVIKRIDSKLAQVQFTRKEFEDFKKNCINELHEASFATKSSTVSAVITLKKSSNE